MADINHDYQRRRLVVWFIRDAVAHLYTVVRRAQDCCDGTPDMKTLWELTRKLHEFEESPEYRAMIALGLRHGD